MAIDPIDEGDVDARLKMNDVIEQVNLLPAALATETNSRAAGDAALAVNLATGDAALDSAKASRAMAADAQIGPGEFPRLFTADVEAASADPTPLAVAPVVGSDGAIIRVTGAGIVGPLGLTRLELSRVYLVRYVVRRATNSPDPANDGVRLAVRWYGSAKTPLANPSGTTVIADLLTLTTADGRQVRSATISRNSGVADFQAPGGTRYARPFVRCFGSSAATDIEIVSIVDITDATAWSPDVSGLDARLGAIESLDPGDRLDALEAAVGTPNANTFKTTGAVAAATIGGSINAIDVLWGAVEGDGRGARYKRVVGPTALQSADGAYWQKVNPLLFLADQATAEAATNNTDGMTPLTTKQEVAKLTNFGGSFFVDPATGYTRIGNSAPGATAYWIDYNQAYIDIGLSAAKHHFHMYGAIGRDALDGVGEMTGFYAHLDGDASMIAGKTARAVYPLRGNGTWGRAATLQQMRGVYAGARITNDNSGSSPLLGDGTMTYAYGGFFEAGNETTGGGTCTNAYGGWAEIRNTRGGLIGVGTGFHAYVRNQTNGGGITTGYGFRVDYESAGAGIGTFYGLYLGFAGGSNRWGIYQSTVDVKNYIRGPIAFGESSSSSSSRVYIEDNATTGSALQVRASSASYTGDVLRITAGTASGSGFDLIQAESSGGDVEFRVRGDGTVTADGSFTGGGADYAEYFRWADGNPSGESRVGLPVVLVGAEIRLATAVDHSSAIIGVVSVNPVVVGDAEDLAWKDKYLRDAWGRVEMEAFTLTRVERFVGMVVLKCDPEDGRDSSLPQAEEHVDEWDEAWLPSNLLSDGPGEFEHDGQRYRIDEAIEIRAEGEDGAPLTRRRLNPDYDPECPYVPRSERADWSPIGLVGKLRLRRGEPVGDRWIKLRDVTKEVEEWLVR